MQQKIIEHIKHEKSNKFQLVKINNYYVPKLLNAELKPRGKLGRLFLISFQVANI